MKLLLLRWAAIAVFVTFVAAQSKTNPACYSSADASRYIDTDLTIAVQPSSPVLVQRYQAPFIRIFCIMFTESGPQCTTAGTSTPILCSRPANDATQPFSCELLSQYVSGSVNTYTERGSVNGPDMIWDLMWDGTSEGPACFPRSITFRALILVSSSTVSSPVVLAFMVIIALLGFFFIVFVLVYFVVQRYRRIDEAGAVTIGGPKPTFQGPQLAVGPNSAPLGDGVDKVYLPVNENGAMVTDQSAAEYGAMQGIRGSVYGTPAVPGRRGPRRASPPAPGDGLPGGAAQFRGAQRTVLGLNSSDEEVDSEGEPYYIDERGARRYRRDERAVDVQQGGSGVRRRKGGKKAKRGSNSAGGMDDTEMTFTSLFPTEEAWGTNGDGEEYIDEEGNALTVDEARRRGMRPPRAFGAPEQRVKYIPQWHMGSFGKGGFIPEIGDGYEDEVHVTKDSTNREFGKEKRTAKAFGRYATPNQGLRRRPDGSIIEDDADGYGSEGGGRGPKGRRGGGGNLRSPFGRRGLEEEGSGVDESGAPGSRRGSPSKRRRGVKFTDSGNEMPDDAFGTDGPTGAARRGRRSGAREGRGFDPDGALAETAPDNFNRGSATVFSPKLDLRNKPNHGGNTGTSPNRSGANGTGDDAKENAFSFRREGPAPVLQCAQCKALLGTGNDEPFCPVDGQRHY